MKTPIRQFLSLLCLLVFAAAAHATPLLVSTDWLAKNLTNDNLVLIDMSDGMQYSRFHLPGARHLPYSAINQHTKTGVSVSAGIQHIIRVLGLLGIEQNKHIVIYDDMGGLNASRLFWELERLGHSRQSILDGGLVKWILEGRKITNKPVHYQKTRFRAPAGKRTNLAVLDDIQKAATSETLILDVRSKEEFQGHPKQRRSGHIPGAKWWEWEQAVKFDRQFTMSPDSVLRESLRRLGLDKPDSPVILYCRSGHRAAHSYFTLRRLGFDNVRLYDGSMAEYEQFKGLPIRRGTAH